MTDALRAWATRLPVLAAALLAVAGCRDDEGHGSIASDIFADRLGDPVPYATEEQLATFAQGERVATQRFSRGDGLGPQFNVTFCAACHERPTFGGAAGLYRNFFIGGTELADGTFIPKSFGGVVRLYQYAEDDPRARPALPEEMNVVAHRNAIPFFGVGLLAQVPEDEILSRADPDDEDEDGISGRPNYVEGFVGRFGLKAQTASLEGFVRGPLFNHLGVTTNPLTEEEKAALPVDSSRGGDDRRALRWLGSLRRYAQAAAPSEPTEDDDGVPDPEMSNEDLFDLVSWVMLLAPARQDELTEVGERGRGLFDEMECSKCHAPRLRTPRGPIPAYSDLLLHDMGPELDDGLEQADATSSEFRTQPLWNLPAVGPYLHDGRAHTIEQAILMHGGEAQRARDAFAAASRAERDAVVEFLRSLGGRAESSPGLIPPDAEVPEPGEYGGPLPGLDERERERFVAGRALFDREFGITEGVGLPRFNGDSCRACHFEPVVAGAGPRGVNVLRHGILTEQGEFAVPAVGTVLHRSTALLRDISNLPQQGSDIVEHRQTPHLFGLGRIDAIPDEVILENADPYDRRPPEEISGKPSWTDGNRLGRFGWKAFVPSLREFTRDALSTEMGMTLPYESGLTFGERHDTDDVADPEIGLDEVDLLTDFMAMLAPPPRQPADDPDAARRGEELFSEVGCAHCHIPELDSPEGPVPLYSDLLLHEVLPEDQRGTEQASATEREFRTAPLWGVSRTAPYMHSGAADTLDEAVRMHGGEATRVRDDYTGLDESDRQALLTFLKTL